MDDRGRIPLWLPPLLLGVATILLFRDFVFSDAMLYGSDTLSLGYMAREFYAQAVSEVGVFPRWNPLLLGGTPFLESLAGGDALYPTSLLLFVLEPYRALGWKLVVHVFAAGLFMFGWVRTLGRSRSAALVAGLAYSVAPFLVTLVRPGHDGKLFVTALTPLLFLAMEWTFTRRGLLPYVGVALVVALVILTTHFQLAYFLFGTAGIYYAFRVVGRWRGWEGEEAPTVEAGGGAAAASRFGLFLAASLLGAAAAGIQLVPAFEYVTEHSRRTATTTAATPEENLAYASSWSLHPEEVMGLVVPEFPGSDAHGDAEWTQGTYWGRNVVRDNHQYAGIVVLLLAGVGFLGGRRRGLRWFLAGVGAVAILYALGRHTPVWRLFYEVLPGISLFRAPDMVAFLFGFAAVTLSAFGVDRLLDTAGEPTRREREGPGTALPTRVLIGATALLLLGTLLAASGVLFAAWTGVLYPEIDPSNRAALEAVRPFVVRGFFVVTLLAGALAGASWAAGRGMLGRAGIVGAVAVLVFVDGFRISAPYVQTLDFHEWSRPDPIVRELLDRQRGGEPFRVAAEGRDRRFQSVRPAMFGLELATGHHPNDLARYRELIGMRGSGRPANIGNPNVQRLLNVRYFVLQGQAEGLEPVLQTQVGGRVYESLYEVPTLPRARLVGAARVVPDDRAVEAILSPGFDPGATAILAEEPGVELPGGPVQGTVEWLERGINRQRLRVSTETPALLVVADNWFPSWRATVGGTEAPVLRAYHTLRAVPVPAGEHEVEIRYDSPLLARSLGLSVVALLALAGLAAFDLLRRRRGSGEG